VDRRGGRPAPARGADLATRGRIQGRAGLEASPFATARWLKGSDAALREFEQFNRANLARDRDGDLVFMAKSPWDVSYQQEKNPDLAFSATKER
jgi:peptide chain release factor 3